MFSKLFVNSKQATDGTSKKIQHFIQESSCTSPFLVPFLCWLSKYWTLQNQVITAESLLLLQLFEFSLSWERWVGISLLKRLPCSTDVFGSAGKHISCHVVSWSVVKYLTWGKAFFQCLEINSLFFHCSLLPKHLWVVLELLTSALNSSKMLAYGCISCKDRGVLWSDVTADVLSENQNIGRAAVSPTACLQGAWTGTKHMQKNRGF